MTYVRRRYVLTQCFQNVSHHVMLMKGIRTLSSTDKDSGIQYLYSGESTEWNPESKSVFYDLT